MASGARIPRGESRLQPRQPGHQAVALGPLLGPSLAALEGLLSDHSEAARSRARLEALVERVAAIVRRLGEIPPSPGT